MGRRQRVPMLIGQREDKSPLRGLLLLVMIRYWYIGSVDFITLMPIDKGYYDYDYQEPKQKRKRNISKATDPEKLARKLGQLDIGAKPQPLTAEDAQRIVMDFTQKDIWSRSAEA